MNFKTIELDINNADLTVINDAIQNIIFKSYWDTVRNDYETATQKNRRITWINHNFCSFKDLAKIDGTKESYLYKISSIIGWKDIKHDLLILYDKRDELELNKKRVKAVNTQIETWEQRIGSIRYDLNKLEIRKQEIYDLISITTNKNDLKILYEELEKIGSRESQLNKDMDTAQKNQRTALCLTNNYKDTTPDKLELDQKGELNLNQNVKIESEEEKLERYANYFKQIKEDIGGPTSEEVNK